MKLKRDILQESLYGKKAEREKSIMKNLRRAIKEELTERQAQFVIMYYIEGLKMNTIAEMTGVNVSTVSRTLKRGKNRLYRCLKYGAGEYFRH